MESSSECSATKTFISGEKVAIWCSKSLSVLPSPGIKSSVAVIK
jgi:hypothetical protein